MRVIIPVKIEDIDLSLWFYSGYKGYIAKSGGRKVCMRVIILVAVFLFNLPSWLTRCIVVNFL
jgi:hypothetical protein